MTDSLGTWLRRTREARQMDLEDAERALRIRRRYLQALEMGDYEALPGPIQARGFLRNYARFLKLSVEDALARYDAEIQGQPVQPRLPEVQPPARGEGLRNWAPPPPTVAEERAAVRANASGGLMRLLVAALVFFGLLAVGSFLWLQFGGALSPQSPEPTVAATPRPVEPTPSPTIFATPVFPVSEDGTVRVRLIPDTYAWVSVSADATVVFQGIAEPNQIVEATANDIVIVSTGNGGAFQLFVNGTDWGLLGGQGEIVRRAWTPQGETSLEDS
jgi:cytoskeletal protein RodZ